MISTTGDRQLGLREHYGGRLVEERGVQPAVRERGTPVARRTTAGALPHRRVEGLIGVDQGEQSVEVIETGDRAQGLTDRLPHREPLQVPGHVLADVAAALQFAVVVDEQLGRVDEA